MKKGQKTIGYIPTVHGRPAVFCDDYQLCVGGGARFAVRVLPTLAMVYSQIRKSSENRQRDGLNLEQGKYGYVRVTG